MINTVKKIPGQIRGTNVLYGQAALLFDFTISCLRRSLEAHLPDSVPVFLSSFDDPSFYREVHLPDNVPVFLSSFDDPSFYQGKPGEQMKVIGPSKTPILCPEKTSQVCRLFNMGVDYPVWYCERCYRLERPQKGRYREFTQFGLEIPNKYLDKFNPDYVKILDNMLQDVFDLQYEFRFDTPRDQSYYIGQTFEVHVTNLDTAQTQIAGGGRYAEGCGFAIGVERLILLNCEENNRHEICD